MVRFAFDLPHSNLSTPAPDPHNDDPKAKMLAEIANARNKLKRKKKKQGAGGGDSLEKPYPKERDIFITEMEKHVKTSQVIMRLGPTRFSC